LHTQIFIIYLLRYSIFILYASSPSFFRNEFDIFFKCYFSHYLLSSVLLSQRHQTSYSEQRFALENNTAPSYRSVRERIDRRNTIRRLAHCRSSSVGDADEVSIWVIAVPGCQMRIALFPSLSFTSAVLASFPFTLYFHLLNIPFKMIFKVIVAAFANPMLRNWLVICHRRTTCILSKVVVAKITLSKVFKAKQLIEFSILKTFIFQVFFLSHNSPIISPCPLPCFWVW